LVDWIVGWWIEVIRDFKHGARLLLRAPGFTTIAILALAIGIGANTAIFSVVNTLLIRPLPYKDPSRLAIVWEHNIPRDRQNNVVAPANFLHWRDMQQSFEDMAALSFTISATLTGEGEPMDVRLKAVSAAFFPIIGVQPAIGRWFTAEEDTPDRRVAVISDRLWKQRFHADPSILQKSITLNDRPTTVVGVMPPGFSILDKTVDTWLPFGFTAAARNPRGRSITVLARLKPGVSYEDSQRDMTRAHAELTRMFPAFNTGWTARVVPLKEQLTGDVRPALLILLGAVGVVLLIACTNVANLRLARATSRQRELAVRAALGAARGRLVRQLMAESVVLATAGGVAGLMLAWWIIRLLRVVVAERLPIPRLEAVGIDGWVLAFTLGVSVLSGVLFGLLPAFSAAGADLTDSLKQGGRSGSAARGARARAAFIVAEFALALVLLAGAGLLVRSFIALSGVDPGFDPRGTVAMDLSLPRARYDTSAKQVDFFRRVFERVDQLPGVQASGGVSFLPLAGIGAATGYSVVGRPDPLLGQEPVCDVRIMANEYLKTMGVTLLRGRLFNEREEADARGRIVINETMARRHWPTEDPIGKRVKISWDENAADEIIGVVSDVRHASLETEPRDTIYWPYPRVPYSSMTLTIRAVGDPTSIVNPVVAIIRELDPQLVVSSVKTMDEVISDSVAERRLTMTMLAIFAGAALLLAAVGIYGVISYSVTQRTQEIGIRMALGARRADVLKMVVGQAMLLAAAGVVLGAAAAALLTRLMAGLLFHVKPGDPLTFATVAIVLAAVAALASYVPGRRATRVDPIVALRAE
jgi:putative ABC transport system permease protein